MNIIISIIIPVHRDDNFLKELFSSLAAQTKLPDEVIVVLDNLTELKNIPSFRFPFQIVVNEKTAGAAAARNKGAARAKGTYLFFLDSDVRLPPDLIENVFSLIADDFHTDAWIGSYDNNTVQKNFTSQFKNLFNHFIHQHSPSVALTFWGACGIIKSNIFKRVGGFDEKFEKSSVEDIELGYRLNAAGYKLKLAKHIQVKHQKRWTFRRLIVSDIFDRALPWTNLLLRFGYVNKKELNLKKNARLSFLFVTLLIFSIPVIFFYPVFGVMMTFSCVGLLIILNLKLYLFFYRQKGLFFCIKAVLFHWFYYLYSGAAFIYATVKYFLRRANSFTGSFYILIFI